VVFASGREEISLRSISSVVPFFWGALGGILFITVKFLLINKNLKLKNYDVF